MDGINHAVPDKRISKVYAVCAFSQAVMEANADIVLGPEYPITYQEEGGHSLQQYGLWHYCPDWCNDSS